MSKIILVTLLAAAVCTGVFAQEMTEKSPVAIGIGPEWNMNSRENFAGGAVLGFDVNLPVAPFAIGVNFTASSNFDGIIVLEPAGLFRWYFMGKGHYGFFAQADVGAGLILEDGELTPLFMGGLRAGYRAPLGTSFYLEPYGRAGYPFMFGVGVIAGVRFPEKEEKE